MPKNIAWTSMTRSLYTHPSHQLFCTPFIRYSVENRQAPYNPNPARLISGTIYTTSREPHLNNIGIVSVLYVRNNSCRVGLWMCLRFMNDHSFQQVGWVWLPMPWMLGNTSTHYVHDFTTACVLHSPLSLFTNSTINAICIHEKWHGQPRSPSSTVYLKPPDAYDLWGSNADRAVAPLCHIR